MPLSCSFFRFGRSFSSSFGSVFLLLVFISPCNLFSCVLPSGLSFFLSLFPRRSVSGKGILFGRHALPFRKYSTFCERDGRRTRDRSRGTHSNQSEDPGRQGKAAATLEEEEDEDDNEDDRPGAGQDREC
ncbi:hypothetical protein BZA05DRAFT_392383 [Tricharina praecox]|uniref:uncharacterized protein n=1 Tax=Tricharina praecox TaxID=43433 RepID=UPI0022206004|nr:uncharacterized protein BZA05DRAFT_392383 [Tricharina praecox]KAI5854736.1 hypothetical protein BZA05DRAFT_392383 [Tricharina praecox]